MEALAKARRALGAARNPDGSLGHLPGQPGHLEPTLLSCAAGLAPPLAWLRAQPWGWGALLLPACLANHADAADITGDTIEQMLARQGEPTEDPDGMLGFDPTLTAWPWVDRTAPWVEPTAYAVLSLKRAGRGAHPRVAQGEALLRDRQCSDGGWNYGNPAVLGAELESYLPPTGWAVLALPGGAVAERGLDRLLAATTQRSTMTLSLALLAHTRHGRDAPEALVSALLARQRGDGSFGGRCDWTALATCAIAAVAGEPHPFEVTA